MPDTRIPYGAQCTWWDSIDKVGLRPSGSGNIPCCPECGKMLFEVGSEEEWFEGVDRYTADGHPLYRDMVEWGRGKCFPNHEALKEAYSKHLASEA